MASRLFIYGTLKRGQVNHHLLAEESYLGPATTLPRFRLLNLGWYPGLALCEDKGRAIEGELWEVSDACLEALDAYEGSEYERRMIEVQPETSDVQAYILRQPDWSCPDAGTCF